MKRVLFIHHGDIQGGAPLSLLYTAQGLEKKGYQPVIGLIKDCKRTTQFYIDKGYEVIQMPWIVRIFFHRSAPLGWNKRVTYTNMIRYGLKWNSSSRLTKKFFTENKFDLVHLNSVALINTAKVLRSMGLPYVWHVREYGPASHDFRWRWFCNELKKTKAVIFLTETEQRSWIDSTENGTIVHNFVDLERFSTAHDYEDLRARYQLKEEETLLLFVGGLRHHKGAGPLLDCLHYLKKNGHKVRCLMPGSKESAPTNPFLKRIGELGLEHECILESFNPDIRAHFVSCDMLVFPASIPHFARPVVEAAALGKPSVVSDMAPINQLIIPGKSGLTFETDNGEDMAKKVLSLAKDIKLRNEMGKNGRKDAEERFNYHKQIDKIEGIYNTVLQE